MFYIERSVGNLTEFWQRTRSITECDRQTTVTTGRQTIVNLDGVSVTVAGRLVYGGAWLAVAEVKMGSSADQRLHHRRRVGQRYCCQRQRSFCTLYHQYRMTKRSVRALKCDTLHPGAFLSAAVWGSQRGGHICIWGGAWIPDDIMHDWMSGVIWHQLRDATLWIHVTLQSCNLFY